MAALTRVLVLGGGGFLGTNLCRALRKAGAQTAAFGRAQVDAAALDGIEWHQGIWPTQSLPLDGVNVVFDLIGAGLPAQANVAATVTATRRLIEACRPPIKIVFASSGGAVYGVTGSNPIVEHTATNPISSYGVAKLAAERPLLDAGHTVLRIANPYGPYQDGARGQGLLAAIVRRICAGQDIAIWGDGSVVRDYIHVDDVVGALLLAATSQGDQRLFNVGSGVGRSVLDVVADLGRVAGVTPRIEFHAARPADVPVNVLDCARLRALGWRPRVAWHDGLARLWRSEHGKHAAVDVQHLPVHER